MHFFSFSCPSEFCLLIFFLACRAGSSEFIVPYPKFSKSIAPPLSVGMRFKMRYETDDAAERRLVDSNTEAAA